MLKIFFTLTLLFTTVSFASQDDWVYDTNTTQDEAMPIIKGTRNMLSMSMSASPMASPIRMSKRSIGLSVGGAKDANNFYENIKHDFLPKYNSLTYEGAFYEHYFKTGKTQTCKELFCPTYAKAITKDIYNGDTNYYLSVGMDSGISNFKRKKLNLVVVLDISGSMGSRFDTYHYDKKQTFRREEQTQTKMQIANRSIVNMMKHLKEDDRFGVVLFDSQAYDAKPLNLVKDTNMDAIEEHILAINHRGGTNWSAGYKRGLHLYKQIDADEAYENRIIFLTDAMPNMGELSKDKLFGMVKGASKKGINTTFIGIGVDFNNRLVEAISKTQGANYYAVHSAKEFKTRLDNEFEFMVTPLVHDISLQVQSSGFDIDAVYGSPQANEATGEVMHVATLFPSSAVEGKVKGGVILIKLKNNHRSKNIMLKLSYKDVKGKEYKINKQIQFTQDSPFYEHQGIKKAIYLTQYVDLMKNWIMDANQGCPKPSHPPISIMPMYPYAKHGLIYPPRRPIFNQLSQWEQRSCPLKLSQGYQKIFNVMKQHLNSDTSLKLTKEIKTINGLLNTKVDKIKKDDWQIIR